MKYKNLTLFLLLNLTLTCNSLAQIASSDFNFHKMEISSSSCSYDVPFSNIEFEKSFSEDSSVLWTNESKAGNYNFGIILVKFNEPVFDEEDEADLIASYLDFLKSQFEVTASLGYNKNSVFKSDEMVKGISDTWTIDGHPTLIQSWINNYFLVVMYIDGENVPAHTSESYFQGFKFAE
jgi:hypothetical protein